MSERGFGVADGVSGWNDYGFSSHEFANQLMEFSRAELEKFDRMAEEMLDSKLKLKKSKKSFVNLETLDDDDQSEKTEPDENENSISTSPGTQP